MDECHNWPRIQAISAGATLLCAYLSFRMMKKLMNPLPEGSRELKRKLCKQLGIPDSRFSLDEYEMGMLHKVLLPHQISCSLKDVAGADRILDKLKQDISFSCAIRPGNSASMLSGSKGLLLYGPPGTGKTMIASAFAREIGAVLINVRGSTILSKYIGDSERLTAGIFSLAMKFAAHGETVILFIDEVDALLGNGASNEHEVMRNVRTEFMQLWDGVLRAARVLVVAATNKPYCLSDAIWRRFSSHFEVPLPDKGARVAIVQKKLRRVQAELREQRPMWARKEFVPRVWFDMTARTTVDPAAPGMPALADLCATVCMTEEKVRSVLKTEMHPLMRAASLTQRYSGSDILEVCKLAARGCVLAEISAPSPPGSPVSASSRTPPASPPASEDARVAVQATGKGGARPGDDSALVCTHERGVNGAGAAVDAAGPVTEEVLLRCISEVKAAANTARHDYASSSNPRGDSVGNPEHAYGDVLRLLQALANSRNGSS